MRTFNNRFTFFVVLVMSVFLVFSCSKLKDLSKEDTKKEDTKKEETKKEDTKSKETTSDAKLYFCEDYKNGEEINVSERFTPGWLTVMLDLRPTGKKLGVGKVELRLTKIKDEDGNKISEKIIDTVPFEVEASWDYTYFKDTDRLKFKTPGTYKVTCQKVDGTPIVSGEVVVIPK